MTIGSLSLITPDPEEQIISVFNMVVYSDYNATNKLHDIALIEVLWQLLLKGRRNSDQNNLIFSYLGQLYSALPHNLSDTMKLTNFPSTLPKQLSSDGALLS